MAQENMECRCINKSEGRTGNITRGGKSGQDFDRKGCTEEKVEE